MAMKKKSKKTKKYLQAGGDLRLPGWDDWGPADYSRDRPGVAVAGSNPGWGRFTFTRLGPCEGRR
jgi:hypothetical protein